MKFGGRSRPLVSVVVPVYNVADYLPHCLESLLAQRRVDLDIVVVDDGSTDGSGAIADGYAARGATGPRGAHRQPRPGRRPQRGTSAHQRRVRRVRRLRRRRRARGVRRHGPVAGGVGLRLRHRVDRLVGADRPPRAAVDAPAAPPGSRRRPRQPSTRRSWATCSPGTSCSGATFWESAGLAWPEGIRYEDQPTTTRAYLAGRFDVLPEIVYHWRIRDDGTSITQQRASVDRPRGPAGDQADGAGERRGLTGRRRGPAVLPGPGAGRRPAPLLPADPGLLRRVVGTCWSRACGSCGATGPWCTADSRRCTGSPAGWSSRVAARTPPR